MNVKGFFIGLDQAINCLFRLNGEFGQPDEMLSARAYRLRESHPNYVKWIDRIFFWDSDHCKECFEIEQNRKQLPQDYKLP